MAYVGTTSVTGTATANALSAAQYIDERALRLQVGKLGGAEVRVGANPHTCTIQTGRSFSVEAPG